MLNKVLDDLRCYGDIMGISVGKKLGICTRNDMSKTGANDDGDDGDRKYSG